MSLMFMRGRKRCGACGLEQKPGDRRRTRRRPRPGATARSAAHVPLPRRRFQNRPALRKALLRALPKPWRIRSRSRWPIRFWGFHSTSWAILAAPARSSRRRCGRWPSAPADQHDLSRLRPPQSGRRSLWRGPCGCKAIRLRPWSAHARPSRMPNGWTIRCRWPSSCAGPLRCSFGPAISRAPKSTSIGLSPAPNPIPWGRYLAVGHGLKGELAIRRGDAKDGVEILQDCLEKLHAVRYELLTTAFNISLAQGLGSDRTVRRRHHADRRDDPNGSRRRETPATCQSYCA